MQGAKIGVLLPCFCGCRQNLRKVNLTQGNPPVPSRWARARPRLEDGPTAPSYYSKVGVYHSTASHQAFAAPLCRARETQRRRPTGWSILHALAIDPRIPSRKQTGKRAIFIKSGYGNLKALAQKERSMTDARAVCHSQQNRPLQSPANQLEITVL